MAKANATERAETLQWLRGISGELSTLTIQHLEEALPWFNELPPARRSALGLVAQSGITSFIEWYEDPDSVPWTAANVFHTAPRELVSTVTLQQTLQLVKASVQVVEKRLSDSAQQLRDAFLHYSRDIAFEAADVYAKAAEARGLWDERLEALVVDAILTGESEEELPSRIAALGWTARGQVAVLVGGAPPNIDVESLRRNVVAHGFDVLIGVHGNRLVLVLGQRSPTDTAKANALPQSQDALDIASALAPHFGSGHLVLGHAVPELVDASKSARAALAGLLVAPAWRNAPRPALADDLLPERALWGDHLARATLVHRIYRPLKARHPDLFETLRSYLDSGRSLEATARELVVHANTVRYRLRRIAEIVGWDPTNPREALILQTAVIQGIVTESESASFL